MNAKRTALLTLLPILIVLVAALPTAAETVDTHVSLLVGFPDAEAEAENQGDLLVSGTVIPISFSMTHGAPGAPYLKSESQRLDRLGQSLAKTLRLARVDFIYSLDIPLEVDKVYELPGPQTDGDLSGEIKLLGFNDQAASYRARFFDRSVAIADSPVTVMRGSSAVVGGQDGDAAPYLFLVVSPVPTRSRTNLGLDGPVYVGGEVLPPRAILKTDPQYTQEARDKGIQGVVVLQVVIDTTGGIKDVKVLKGLPAGLEESAVEAIRAWRFEPATLKGNPVEVYYNLTINFRLPSKDDEGS